MSSSAGVGLVVAMRSEARLLGPGSPTPGHSQTISSSARLVLSGMGQRAAHAAASQLIAEGVEALAVFGVAGGLDPAYRKGSLVCASEIYAADGQRYATDTAWCQALQAATQQPCHFAPLLSCATALSTPAAKQDAARRYGAVAVDMESAAVAAVAAAHQKPLLVLRAIADEAGDILPEALQSAVDYLGQPRPWKMLTTLLRHPGLIPALPGLAQRMHLASRALQHVVQQAGPDLAWTRRHRPIKGP